jgi:hypothetical protein
MNVMVSKLEDGVSVDALRAALASALQAQVKSDEAVSRQRAGIDRARGGVRAAEAAAKDAEKAVTKAREAHAEAIAAAAANDAAPPASGVRAARQAQVDSEDEVEAAKAALDQLRGDLPTVEAAAREANIAVEAAINAILAPHARQLLAKGMELKCQLAPVVAVLSALSNDTPAGKPHDQYLDAAKMHKPLAEVRKDDQAFFETFNKFDRGGADPWVSARERLRADPDAALPDFAALLPATP